MYKDSRYLQLFLWLWWLELPPQQPWQSPQQRPQQLQWIRQQLRAATTTWIGETA